MAGGWPTGRGGATASESPSRLRLVALAAALAVLAGCTPRQEGEALVDIEPDRMINTDLTMPKNPRRWGYLASRVATGPREPFPGYLVVVANPFAARLLEEGRVSTRGAKLAQLVYEARTDERGVVPGPLRRMNLLVQDPERYGATGGWGFASFDGEGHEIPIAPATDCLGCHSSGPITPFRAAGRR